MDVFPAFIPLAGRRVAIVGEDNGAQAKARLFEGSPATLIRLGGQDALDPAAYRGVALAFISGPQDFAVAASKAARQAGVLVNVVDRPLLGDFQTPSIVDRGAVIGAVGTGGSAPVLATQLRNALEALWPEGLGRIADLLRLLQPEIRARLPDLDRRRAYLRELVDGPAAKSALAGEMEQALAIAREALLSPTIRQGVIWRLEAPSDADLISLRALRVLGRVDRLAAPGDADPALLAFARRDALRFTPSEATPDVLAQWTRSGLEGVCVGPAGAEIFDFETARRLGAVVRPLV